MKLFQFIKDKAADSYAEFQSYNRLVGIAEIARRYFAMNAFDGVLTTIGVLVGNYLAGVRDVLIPIRIGVATSIAMGISGLWGAYLTEAAERKRELAELENISLIDQSDTNIGRASRTAVIVVSVGRRFGSFFGRPGRLDSPVLRSADPECPAQLRSGRWSRAVELFGLGMFLGKVSKQNIWGYGMRTLIAGLVAIAINFLLGGE